MQLDVDTLVVDTPDPDRLARFWEQLLGWGRTHDEPDEVVLSPADGRGTPILFARCADEKVGKNRLHLDLRPDDQDAAMARALELGARPVDVGQHADPRVTWVVLADPDGNEFCILAPRRG